MSQFRLARFTLMLAAIGLNAAPALMIGAHAQARKGPAVPQQGDARTQDRDSRLVLDAATAAKGDTVRPELFKLIDPAVVKQLLEQKNYADLQTRITQADVFPDKTPYETYVLDRMKVALGSATGNDPMTITALEAVLASGRMPTADQSNFVFALGNLYYNAKNYPKAIEAFKRYQKDSTTPEKVAPALVRAYYLNNDFAAAKEILLAQIAASEKAGQPVSVEDLRLLGSAAAKLKDDATYLSTMEKLVAQAPTDEYWTDLLRRMLRKPGFNRAHDVDFLRLSMAAKKTMTADEYIELAELDLAAGFPTEAKKAMDAGFAAGVLPAGAQVAQQKALRDKATKGAADDAKNIASGEAGAAKAKDGLPLVNLGYAYVTMGQFDKGLPLMEQGIAKGVSKRPEDAKLRLGAAYAMAGRKAEAIKTLQTVKGDDGSADLAKYWMLWVNRSAAPAAVPAPAPAAK
jgi:tetratricopeptide (TPR) repeat protein